MRRDPQEFMLFMGPLLLAVLMLLIGCTPESARWTPTEAPKDNKVEFIVMTHQVRFAPGATVLTPVEAKSLADFLDGVALDYGDQVTIDTGPQGANTATNALATKRAEVVTVALRKMRVRVKSASRPTVDGALARDGIVVAVGRYVVTGPQCPDRRKPEADDFTNTTTSNYGCATATNLGMMIANPADLVRGTPGGPSDGEAAARGVQRYRAGDFQKSLSSELSRSGGSGGGN